MPFFILNCCKRLATTSEIVIKEFNVMSSRIDHIWESVKKEDKK